MRGQDATRQARTQRASITEVPINPTVVQGMDSDLPICIVPHHCDPLATAKPHRLTISMRIALSTALLSHKPTAPHSGSQFSLSSKWVSQAELTRYRPVVALVTALVSPIALQAHVFNRFWRSNGVQSFLNWDPLLQALRGPINVSGPCREGC